MAAILHLTRQQLEAEVASFSDEVRQHRNLMLLRHGYSSVAQYIFIIVFYVKLVLQM